VHAGDAVPTWCSWPATRLLNSCRHVAARNAECFPGKTRYTICEFLTRLNEKHPTFAWLSVRVGLTDRYIRLSRGEDPDLRIFSFFMLATSVREHEHDVIVSGRRRGCRRPSRPRRKRVGRTCICKSSWQGPTRSMAEGDRAALGTGGRRTNCQVHVATPWRRQDAEQWRMAQLHAQEEPERVLELEPLGCALR